MVTEYGVATVLRGFPQRLLELAAFPIGYVHHSLALPDLPAAHAIHIPGEDDFVSRFIDQRAHFLNDCVFDWRSLCDAHRLIDTAGEIDNLEVSVTHVSTWFWLSCAAGHSRSPQRKAYAVCAATDSAHQRGTKECVAKVRGAQNESQIALETAQMISCELAHAVAGRVLHHV